MDFKLEQDYIELIKLLKLTDLCSTGGEAKMVVESGYVTVDGEVEERKRRKLRQGMVVEFDGQEIKIV